MSTHEHADDTAPRRPDARSQAPVRAGRGRTWWIFAGLAAIALFLLVLEHRAHVIGWLPWLILLACPLMHFFMHGGGHGHRHRRDTGDES